MNRDLDASFLDISAFALDFRERHPGQRRDGAKSQRLINNQALIDKLRARPSPDRTMLANFWEALIFDRDCYTCVYCGRNAFEFYAHTGRLRTLWLVVDHENAVAKAPGIYTFQNSVTSCWSCNTMKGPFPNQAFLAELDALVDARLLLRGAPNKNLQPTAATKNARRRG